MANYQQTEAPGTAWRRCHKVILDNPVNGARSALFLEQEVATVGDRTIASEVGHCQSGFDPESLVFVRNPETGEPTGEYVTQGYVYLLLHSLYLAVAENRDNPATAAVLGAA